MDKTKKSKLKKQKQVPVPLQPWRYLIVATGNIYEDRTQAESAVLAGADIIAHPGLITPDEAALAAQKGIFLEISARSGHSFTNGHVVKVGSEAGAKLLLNSDGHAPNDLITQELAEKVAEGAGLPEGSLQGLLSNSRLLLEKIGYAL